MIIEKIGTGKTVEEAKENALLEMGIAADTDVDFDVEVLEMPQKKVLGIFGGSLAKVKITRNVADPKPEAAKPAAKKAEKKDEAQAQPAPAKKHKPVGHLNDDEIANVVNYLENILTHMGVNDFSTDVVPLEDGIMININGSKIGVAIGRKGETIDALQHLVSLVANRGKDDYFRVTLNPGEYREKRESVLIGVAKKSAEKAQRMQRNIVLEPMNSYERRIIHNAVQEIEGVESWSVGEGDHRRVVIGNKEFVNNRTGGRNDRRGGRGGYNRTGRYNNRGRSGRNDYKVSAQPTREPIKDSAGPLYGVIKHED